MAESSFSTKMICSQLHWIARIRKQKLQSIDSRQLLLLGSIAQVRPTARMFGDRQWVVKLCWSQRILQNDWTDRDAVLRQTRVHWRHVVNTTERS